MTPLLPEPGPYQRGRLDERAAIVDWLLATWRAKATFATAHAIAAEIELGNHLRPYAGVT